MLRYVDLTLRQLFLARIPDLTSPDQIRFQPPDDKWQAAIAAFDVAVNVYLVELRENRLLRSNAADRLLVNGTYVDTPAPPRLDCHYLISAWHPGKEVGDVEPSIEEHDLLYKLTAALMNQLPFVPRTIFAPDPLPLGFPGFMADADLPVAVGPVDGFLKYAEFWGTMGPVHPWKPAVYLILTVPVLTPTVSAGPMVTTATTEYRRNGQNGLPASAERRVLIGGTVFDPSGLAVVDAWVRLETSAGTPLTDTTTDALGRFTFPALREDHYQIRTRAAGFGEKTRSIDVPAADGEYDVHFP